MGRSGQLAGRQMKCISGISLPILARLLSIEESIRARYHKWNLWNAATRRGVLTEIYLRLYMHIMLTIIKRKFFYNSVQSFRRPRVIFQIEDFCFTYVFSFSFIFCIRAVLISQRSIKIGAFMRHVNATIHWSCRIVEPGLTHRRRLSRSLIGIA